MSVKFNVMQERILELLEDNSPRPMKISEIAMELDRTYQTVSNNLTPLTHNDIVRVVRRDGNANLYGIGLGRDLKLRLKWTDGDYKTVREILEYVGNPENKKPTGDILYLTEALAVITGRAAKAVSDENPEPLTHNTLKAIQVELFKRRQEIAAVLQMYDDIMKADELWDPKDCVKSLILGDREITIPQALEIAQTAYDRLRGNPPL